MECRFRSTPSLQDVLVKNLMVSNGADVRKHASATMNFPELPRVDGQILQFSQEASKEENNEFSQKLVEHLQKIEFSDTIITENDYDQDNFDDLPTLSRLTEDGEVTLCKISKDGQIIELSDRMEWWSKISILSTR